MRIGGAGYRAGTQADDDTRIFLHPAIIETAIKA
jgi:hypothetical protein